MLSLLTFKPTNFDDVLWQEAKIEKMKYEHLTREAALTENELLEEEYKKKLDEANKELSLENDLAGMWVLVAKLKRGVLDISDLSVDDGTKV
jgi:centromeric protein E